ncbi:MAG TPA: hypothetical protein H9671_10590 [Firmicutes bacterium]|nr:hypothetical protein [Bacillota bacterium]
MGELLTHLSHSQKRKPASKGAGQYHRLLGFVQTIRQTGGFDFLYLA